MCRFSLSIFILMTLCVAHSQSEASAENLNADSNDANQSETHADTDNGDTVIPGQDTEKEESVKNTKAHSVTNRRQKTFLQNPNYFTVNKLFEEESKKSYIRKRYEKLPLPHPGFKGNLPDHKDHKDM